MIYGLKSFGASVTVLALNTLKHHVESEDIPEELKKDFHLVNTDTRIKPLKLIVNLLFSNKAYSLQRFESDEFKSALESLLNNNYDIVQVEGLAMTHYLDTIKKACNSHTVYRAHNIENRIMNGIAEYEKNPLKRFYFSVLAKRIAETESAVINSFSGVAAMTMDDLNWFVSAGLGKPSAVIQPSAITGSEQNELNDEIPLSVGYIGALDWRPNIYGIRWFIENVWPRVINSVAGANLHIAGRNPSKKVSGFCRGKGITFYGEVESSARFISDKSVMIVPLFAGSGIRMKIIDGMSSGKSIIATSTAASGMIYSPGKDLVIADTPHDFSAALTSLLNDKARRITLGENARKNVMKNYNILVSTENLIKFYSQLT
jgi:glycosyltransferase involved in cell wall biosynthesis